MKKIIFIIYIFFIFYKSWGAVETVPEFSRMDLIKFDNAKEKIFLIFLSKKDILHKEFLKNINKYLINNKIDKYNYGYIDIEKNKKLIDFFKVKSYKNPGIIVYNFESKDFFILENIEKIEQVAELTEKINKKTINWYGASKLEAILFKITGIRFGKYASLIGFGVLILFGLILTFVSGKFINKIESEEKQKENEKNKPKKE